MPLSFKDKLNNYEVQPPKAAWEHIAEELTNSNELLAISNKLFDYQVSPPPNTWENISEALYSANNNLYKASPKKLPFRILSYAMIAAAILGGIVLGVFYLYNSNELAGKSSISSVNKTPGSVSDPKKTNNPPVTLYSKPDLHNTHVPAVASARINRNYGPDKVLQNAKVKSSLFLDNEFGIMITAKPIRNANGEIIQHPTTISYPGSKYISITGPNGQQTKISSKFLHLLLFLNDDNDIDQVDGYFDKNFLESLIWKSRFREWRKEIINTSFVPSSTNFMDILELKDLITKDNK